MTLAGATMFAGCAASNRPITDLRADSESYDAVFEATLDAIRDTGFQLDRVDRRFGVISSQPLVAGSVLEPWRDPQATSAQAVESTLNHQRRVVRVRFEPASGFAAAIAERNEEADESAEAGEPASIPAEQPDVVAQVEDPESPPLNIAAYDGTLRVDVQCSIERSHRPGRRIETTSTRRVSYAVDPLLLERGIPGQYWEPVARDPWTEQAITQRLARRASDHLTIETIPEDGDEASSADRR